MNAFPDQILNPKHLTPDQIDDHLIGDLAPAPAAHLAACTLCSDRVSAAASPIASFQQVSTAWSERRSATLPLPVPAVQRTIWQRHMAWATASLSLAFGIAIINASHQFSFDTTQPMPAPSAAVSAQLTPVQQPVIAPRAAQSATQLSADNHMLRAIDTSLDPSTDSPTALGLAPAAAIRNGPPTSIQD
jgi:hypothetical protein